MKDNFGRVIDYARISITDQCNLRCAYCMPSSGVPGISHAEVLRFEEILRFARILVSLGITRFKITGGEPFVRGGIIDFLSALKMLDGVSQVTITTNGILLKKYIHDLLNIGIDGVNISLDTLDRENFRNLTGFDKLGSVLSSIDSCAKSGLRTKINTVLVNGDNVVSIAEFAREKVAAVRFIEMMPIGQYFGEDIFTVDDLTRSLEDSFGKLEYIDEKLGNGPATYYRVNGFAGKIGIIPAMSRSFCANCNRIRLTSGGFLKLCLSKDEGIDLKLQLRGSASDSDIAGLVKKAIVNKPEFSGFDKARYGNPMHMIGG